MPSFTKLKAKNYSNKINFERNRMDPKNKNRQHMFGLNVFGQNNIEKKKKRKLLDEI